MSLLRLLIMLWLLKLILLVLVALLELVVLLEVIVRCLRKSTGIAELRRAELIRRTRLKGTAQQKLGGQERGEVHVVGCSWRLIGSHAIRLSSCSIDVWYCILAEASIAKSLVRVHVGAERTMRKSSIGCSHLTLCELVPKPRIALVLHREQVRRANAIVLSERSEYSQDVGNYGLASDCQTPSMLKDGTLLCSKKRS